MQDEQVVGRRGDRGGLAAEWHAGSVVLDGERSEKRAEQYVAPQAREQVVGRRGNRGGLAAEWNAGSVVLGKAHRAEGCRSNANRRTACHRRAGNDRRGNPCLNSRQ